MRKIALFTILGPATFFLVCDWYWITRQYDRNLNNGTSSGTISDCDSAVKEAFSLCKKCAFLKETKVMRNRSTSIDVFSGRASMELIRLFGKTPQSRKYLSIGIPTIARKKENYLHQTLQSVIESMSMSERNNVTILVLFVDMEADVRRKRAKETAFKFANNIESGLLQLYQVLPELYPRVNITRRTFNDSVERIEWRSKQVLDFAFLLMCSQNLSDYFLILEDDVITSPQFVTNIQKFVEERRHADWVSLTFSSFFIIGRLFRNRDLDKLVDFLVLFHLEKPVDLLIIQFLDLLVPSKVIVTRRVPGLFQHIGVFSSLDGKVQKAKDRSFTGYSRVYHFQNPAADLVTTLGVYKKHYPELCYYDSNKFFWGSAPKRNDTFDVILHKPAKVKKIFVNSGSASHRDDVIKYAELKVASKFLKMTTDKRADCDKFYSVAIFERGKADVSSEEALKTEIQCIRIEFIKRHSNWVLINEISIDAETVD
ncbi:alpha-1,3-mannosyl-glycoprotein 4-beta-N-acetylglucosaminyltransferase C [Nephila pilipes]|uniref:Alpha-1,3-mannosyl-glycoprotein 4-beta-N-acetylglucosaminyltransferase C n=1 Tax=Nephila pilipes TaxID=299642 RepID=A0A8X6NB92_NEPPI|nr:alpha-1,3-mannosyl-glycoprotein 4-beta-N-acetylglucosaminyltransferase C [Nephila pilipes]